MLNLPHHPSPWGCRAFFQDFSHKVKYLFRACVDDNRKFLYGSRVQIAGMQCQHNRIGGAGNHAVFGVLRNRALATGMHLPYHKFFCAFYGKGKYCFNRIAGVAGAKKEGIPSNGLNVCFLGFGNLTQNQY